MLKAIRPDTRLVYVCNPNNPTGTICDHKSLKDFIAEASKRATVLVDEAYIEFSGQPSLARMATENKNLIVTRTFSKAYGLAGNRIGYAIAHTSTIEKLDGIQLTNPAISVVSAAGALASLNDNAFIKETISLNAQVQKYAVAALEGLGIACIPSSTNFIYMSLADYPHDFFARLEKHNILGTYIYENDGKWTRLTLGTITEMQQLIKAVS